VRKSAVAKTADAPRLSYWMRWAGDQPHKAVISQAQGNLREEHPELTRPLDNRYEEEFSIGRNLGSREGTNALRSILRSAGHPQAETAWVGPHPSPRGSSQVAVDDRGNLGAVLLPSRWDLGTVAHEGAHLVHAHHAGIDLAAMARGDHPDGEIKSGVPDHVMHGPEFARHYADALDVLSPGAGDDFLRHRQAAVGLIGNVRARFHKLPREFEGSDPIRREAAAGGPYRQPHQGPDAGDGEALHELGTKGFYPPDVYDRPHDYGGDPATWQKMRDAKGDPDRRVVMYRAMPAPHHKINPGDWVTLSRDYAVQHAQESDGDHYAVLKKQVRASELRNDGNDLHEWTYHGPVQHFPGLEYRGGAANGWRNLKALQKAQESDQPQEWKDADAEAERQDRAVDRSRKRDETAAMVYLHVPPGTLHAPQGGEAHHHVTLAYLPKNMTDEDFDKISSHVEGIAARHAPFKGTFGGHETFPPGADRFQKRTSYVPLHAPEAHALHADLAHLSRARYETFAPHATLAYLRPGDENPGAHPETSVPFTHVHVRRGDEVHSFPLTGPSRREAAAQGRGANWVDDARRTISDLAAAKGHALEWTADDPDERKPYKMAWWRATCTTCGEPAGRPPQRIRKEVVLPQDPAEDADHWLGDNERLPHWLVTRCSMGRSGKPKGARLAQALRPAPPADHDGREGRRREATRTVCEHCGQYEEAHPKIAEMYHQSPARNRNYIGSTGLKTEFDNGEGYTEPGVYMSRKPGSSDTDEDIWKVNTQGLRLHPDEPGQMHEFRDVGGSYFSHEDISPDRLTLHHRGPGNKWTGYAPKHETWQREAAADRAKESAKYPSISISDVLKMPSVDGRTVEDVLRSKGDRLRNGSEHMEEVGRTRYYDLQEDMAQNGQRTPVLIQNRKGRPTLIDGHHRVWNAVQLGHDSVFYTNKKTKNQHPPRTAVSGYDGLTEREASAESGPWYHGTQHPFSPGDHVTSPASRDAAPEWNASDPEQSYASTDKLRAWQVAVNQEHARPGRGAARVFEVHPTGDMEPDPVDNLPSAFQTRHPMRVVRELPRGEIYDARDARQRQLADDSLRDRQATPHRYRSENGEYGCAECRQAPGAPQHTAKLAVSGYDGLTGKSAMIYLDLPPGAVRPVPGGVEDSHVTICYLGKNVSDEAFEEACRRTQAAAAQHAPMDGVLRGIDIFPPSKSSDGKVVAFVPAYIGGVGLLRRALEDLSGSEHTDYRPHVTLAYLQEGDSLPAPHPAVPLRFTRVHVKRGDDVVSFPLTGGASG
jgi:2'-5' RNA ligase